MSTTTWDDFDGTWLTTAGTWAEATAEEIAADPIKATLAQLTAAGLRAYDGRPTVTPPGPYVVLTVEGDRDPYPRRYDPKPRRDVITIQLMAVSRDRAICRETAKAADRALNHWRPTPDLSTAAWRRIDSGPMLTDGPAGDIRHSITTIYRSHVPRKE